MVFSQDTARDGLNRREQIEAARSGSSDECRLRFCGEPACGYAEALVRFAR